MSSIEIVTPGGVQDWGGGPIQVVPNPPSTSTGGTFHVSPDAFRQGQFLNVILVGDGTAWDFSTILSFSGAGITVNSTVTISPTSAYGILTVDFNAPLGKRDVIMTTGVDVQTALGGIEVFLNDPGWLPLKHHVKTYFPKPKTPARDKLAAKIHDLRERADEENLLRLME